MVATVLVSVGRMLVSASAISTFVDRHPTIEMLALSFLLLIGATLIAEGFGHHIPKAYVYFPIVFSLFVEMLDLRMRTRRDPVRLHSAMEAADRAHRAPADRASARPAGAARLRP